MSDFVWATVIYLCGAVSGGLASFLYINAQRSQSEAGIRRAAYLLCRGNVAETKQLLRVIGMRES